MSRIPINFRLPPENMSHDNDPIAVTANLRDLVRVFVDGVYHHGQAQSKREAKAVNDCFQILLGRKPTPNEEKRISPW